MPPLMVIATGKLTYKSARSILSVYEGGAMFSTDGDAVVAINLPSDPEQRQQWFKSLESLPDDMYPGGIT